VPLIKLKNSLSFSTIPHLGASETVVSETVISETVVSETVVSETVVSETVISETVVSETVVSETVVSETVVSETVVSETVVSETGVQKIGVEKPHHLGRAGANAGCSCQKEKHGSSFFAGYPALQSSIQAETGSQRST
jgi:hypothetical protein